jgi:serine/threonine-protein kinase
MSPRQAASMMMRVADAIHYANKRGLVHRDIKPSNIFLSRDLKPKLLDFGTALAPVREVRDDSTRQLVGTPNYMSPEQAKGDALDARSDIFSLGTILYELLAGRRAFDGRTIDETLDQVIAAHPRAVDRIRPDTPATLATIVRKAMERDPDQRYPKASDFRNALAEFVEGSRATGADVSVAARPIEPTTPEVRSRRPLKVVGGVALALVAMLVVYFALKPAPVPPPPVIESVVPTPVLPPAEEPKAEPVAPVAEEPKPADTKASPRRRNEAAATAVPVRDGVVKLAVAPWGEIIVNGESRGVSPPLTQLSLPPGAHTIEVRNTSAAPFVVRIELRSGETISLQHRF